MTAYGEGLSPSDPYGVRRGKITPPLSPHTAACPAERPKWLYHGYHCTFDKELRRCFGITCGTYWDLFWNQGGRCAICGGWPKSRRLDLDHDHDTGEIRGLAHRACNQKVTVEVVRYLANPPARPAGLVVPADRMKVMEKREKEKAARRRARAKERTKEDQRTNGPPSNLDRLRAMTKQGGP
jgi:Recombination endonuclease VII